MCHACQSETEAKSRVAAVVWVADFDLVALVSSVVFGVFVLLLGLLMLFLVVLVVFVAWAISVVLVVLVDVVFVLLLWFLLHSAVCQMLPSSALYLCLWPRCLVHPDISCQFIMFEPSQHQ